MLLLNMHTHTSNVLAKYIKGMIHKSSCFVERDISSTVWLPTFTHTQHSLKLLLKVKSSEAVSLVPRLTPQKWWRKEPGNNQGKSCQCLDLAVPIRLQNKTKYGEERNCDIFIRNYPSLCRLYPVWMVIRDGKVIEVRPA